MKTISLPLAVASAVVLLLGAGCEDSPTPGAGVTVGRVQGQFELQRAGSRVWARSTGRGDEAKLLQGDRVRTLSERRAVVNLAASEGEIKLSPETTIEIALASEDATELLQFRGSTKVQAKGPMTVRTPLITGGIRGTSFRVQVPMGTHTRMATDEAAAEVELPGPRQSALIRQGQEVVAEYGRELMIRAQRLPAPSLQLSWYEGAPRLTGVTEADRQVEVLVDGSILARTDSGDAGAFSAVLPPDTLSDEAAHGVLAFTLGADGLRGPPSAFLVLASGTMPERPLYLGVSAVTREPGEPSVQAITGFTRPGTTITFEDQPAVVDPSGSVSARVSLPAGATNIRTLLGEGDRIVETFLQVAP